MKFTQENMLKKYPRLCSHIIAESLGYATPRLAANMIIGIKTSTKAGICEWAPTPAAVKSAVKRAITNRHSHKGFMTSYKKARQIVELERSGKAEFLFASWF